MDETNPNLELPFHDMSERHAGLTEALALCYHEAARVCLDRHHKSPALFAIQDEGAETNASAVWEQADDRCRAAYANEIDTTEWGAYACALASTELRRGLVAIHRAQTKTGADYYLAPAGAGVDDLEEAIRLEISGIDKGTLREIEVRLLEKVEQARRGKGNLPALATVVGFQLLKVAIRDVVKRV